MSALAVKVRSYKCYVSVISVNRVYETEHWNSSCVNMIIIHTIVTPGYHAYYNQQKQPLRIRFTPTTHINTLLVLFYYWKAYRSVKNHCQVIITNKWRVTPLCVMCCDLDETCGITVFWRLSCIFWIQIIQMLPRTAKSSQWIMIVCDHLHCSFKIETLLRYGTVFFSADQEKT